jgi:NADPH:quinone reductase-like Zn-dependent oxidoreductase
MARVVRFYQTGGPEVLRIEETQVPPPGKGEVQIQIKALGLNRAEAMFRRDQYLEAPKLPARLGYEAAGTVAAVGPGVRPRGCPQSSQVPSVRRCRRRREGDAQRPLASSMRPSALGEYA